MNGTRLPERYHIGVRRLVSSALLVAVIALPGAWAQTLPDLGGTADATLTPQMERTVGESIMRDIRSRDRSYLDEPEIVDYLERLGVALLAGAPQVRQDFEFFAMRDPSINAFALPGGFIGVHTGLLLAAESESELAAVLAHEIAHVTQRHIARLIGAQQQLAVPALAAIAAAILLGRSRPDLAGGAAAAVQAGAIQSQLNYTRDFEREADRIGMQTLSEAGFDARAMGVFFDKLQRQTRVADDGSVPSYLRTHPVTSERIADVEGRAATLQYRQRLDSLEFHLVRAKLRAETGDAKEAVTQITSALRDRRYASEAAARYGLVSALLRAEEPRQAAAELDRLRATKASSPMIESLAARVQRALGQREAALATLREAMTKFPNRRFLAYDTASALQEAGRNEAAIALIGEQLRMHPRDARLIRLQAQTYAALGRRLLQHQSQAELYVLQGSLPAAIEQLQLARAAGDGDFYQLSAVEARLKELRARHSEELREKRR